jgi:putative transposase
MLDGESQPGGRQIPAGGVSHRRLSDFRMDVWRYMAGVASNLHGHALRVGGYFDHAHLLLRIPAKVAVSDFVRQLKASTSKHINQDRNALHRFHWQDGYGAFTVSRSRSGAVVACLQWLTPLVRDVPPSGRSGSD